jgi:hypothetical protein
MGALNAFAFLFIVCGLLAAGYGLYSRARAGRVSAAPFAKTGDAAANPAVAGPKGEISVEGKVLCGEPLVSPVTGTRCLYYELTLTKLWKVGDRQHSEELRREKRAAPFELDDGSGPVFIDATKGGDFDGTKDWTETKGLGLLGTFSGKELAFGNFKLEIPPFTPGSSVKYAVSEKLLPVVERLYANGMLDRSAVRPPGWRMLILSHKSRDEILGSATLAAKRFLPGGAVAAALGVAMAVTASVVGGSAAQSPPAPASPAAVAAAQPSSPIAASSVTAAPAAAPTSSPANSAPAVAPHTTATKAAPAASPSAKGAHKPHA